MIKRLRPRITVISWGTDGYWLYHDSVRYGPWYGFREDGAPWDIWDVHDWCVEHIGVCPFPFGPDCSDDCERPDSAMEKREQAVEDGRQLGLRI